MANETFTYLERLHDVGFVKVPGLFSPDEVATLKTACERATAEARAGEWPFIRTLPKQFPPWPSTPGADGIWGVQHLLHPEMPGRAVFASSYFHPKLLAVVEAILGVSGGQSDSDRAVERANSSDERDEKLVMELYNLLVKPDSDFELRWHRDDIPPTATAEEEEAALGIAGGRAGDPVYSHTQWNLALEPDDSLIVVPGTHKRVRNQAERDAGVHDVLPEQLVVHLDAGDVVFYDNDILHRGKYDATRRRFTLHGSIGKKGFTEKRARNVLQHGVGEWIGGCDFDDLDASTLTRAESMKANLVHMGQVGNTGFSQTD